MKLGISRVIPFNHWFITVNRIINESLRWLVVSGKHKRAERVLRLICEVNNSKLPDNFAFKVTNNDEVSSMCFTTMKGMFFTYIGVA